MPQRPFGEEEIQQLEKKLGRQKHQREASEEEIKVLEEQSKESDDK